MAQSSAKRGFFRGALEAMMVARQRQASAYVNGALLMLDDETLKASGYNRDELMRRANVSYLL